MVFRGCIFDLDGVIVDTARYHFLAWKKLADKLGIPFTEEDNEELKGVSRIQSLETILEMGGRQASDAEKMEFASMKNLWFVDYLKNMTRKETLAGVLTFLDDLEKNGIRKAIGSASKNARLALENIGLIDRFDKVIDGTMVSKAKPDPEVFLLAAEGLGLPPEECIVFEDAVAGIAAAHNGNMKCIGIGDAVVLHEAEAVVDSLNGHDWTSIQKMIHK